MPTPSVDENRSPITIGAMSALPIVIEVCSTECPFPPAEWSGKYDHQLERWDGVPTSGPYTHKYTTCGTTGGAQQDYDDDDENEIKDD
jgi:hypothetical protein